MKKFILPLIILPCYLAEGLKDIPIDTFGHLTVQEKLNKDLLEAIDYKDYALVEKFLKQGADKDAIDEYGNTALQKSLDKSCLHHEGPPGVHTCRDNFRTANVLIKYGADIDKINNHGKTALFMYVEKNQLATVKFLMSQNADPFIKCGGKTALSIASSTSPWPYKNEPIAPVLEGYEKSFKERASQGLIEKPKVAAIPLGKEAQDQFNKNVRDQLNHEYLRTLDWLANVKWDQTNHTASFEQLWHAAIYG